MKVVKRILIGLFSVLAAVLVIFCIVIFSFSYRHYRSLKPLEQGIELEGDGIPWFDLNGTTYYGPDQAEKLYDLSSYQVKAREETGFHIVTSSNPITAVFRDYKVHPLQDDPNGYMLQAEDDLFTGFLYYSENMVLPEPDNNSIRGIIVVPWGTLPSSDERSITDKTAINAILECVDYGGNPYELIANEELYDYRYSLWIDYSDFPMYQRIYTCESVTNKNLSLVSINTDESYFSDYKVDGSEVFIYCHVELYNLSYSEKHVKLLADTAMDALHGLVNEKEIYCVDAASGSESFAVPPREQSSFDVVIKGTFAGYEQRYSRNMPDIVIFEIEE